MRTGLPFTDKNTATTVCTKSHPRTHTQSRTHIRPLSQTHTVVGHASCHRPCLFSPTHSLKIRLRACLTSNLPLAIPFISAAASTAPAPVPVPAAATTTERRRRRSGSCGSRFHPRASTTAAGACVCLGLRGQGSGGLAAVRALRRQPSPSHNNNNNNMDGSSTAAAPTSLPPREPPFPLAREPPCGCRGRGASSTDRSPCAEITAPFVSAPGRRISRDRPEPSSPEQPPSEPPADWWAAL